MRVPRREPATDKETDRGGDEGPAPVEALSPVTVLPIPVFDGTLTADQVTLSEGEDPSAAAIDARLVSLLTPDELLALDAPRLLRVKLEILHEILTGPEIHVHLRRRVEAAIIRLGATAKTHGEENPDPEET